MLRSYHSEETWNTLLTLRSYLSQVTFSKLLMLRSFFSQETCNTLLMLHSFLSQVTFSTLLMLRSFYSEVTCNTLLTLQSFFLKLFPTFSWCYAVSFSSSFQHTLDTTCFFSSNFPHALDATLTFSQIMSNVGTCRFAQESHSAQKNNQACQTSHSFFHHGKKLVRKGFKMCKTMNVR